MQKSISKFLFLLLVLGISITACKKEDDTLFESQSAEDDNSLVTHEDETSAIIETSYGEGVDMGGRTEQTQLVLGVGVVTYDKATRTMTINFGTSNQMCADGKMRRGKILVQFDGEGRPTRPPFNYKSTTTHDSYYVNDNKIEGTRIDEVTTNALLGRVESKITVTNRRITFTDGTFAIRNWTGTRVLTRVGAEITSTATGNGSGTNRKGRTYTSTTKSPIIAKSSCNNFYFPIQGVIEITTAELSDKITVDYGTGTCDKTFTITYKNKVKTITR
jgi:hypothetical protein